MEHRKTQVAAAVGAALLIGATAAQAQNPGWTGAQPGITVQLYGQLSRAVMFVDDGAQTKGFHVDGQPSSTRFGINAAGQVAPGLRVGGRIETEMKSNPSNAVSFGPQPNSASTGAANAGNVLWTERWLDAFVEGAWGRVNMGQGSAAADDVSTLDLSGTNMPNGTCPTDWGGAINFRTSTGALGPTMLASLGDCNDFQSRYDRLQYTSPTFAGFRAQVSTGQQSASGEAYEGSIWYTGKLAGDLQAAIGYSNVNTSTGAGAPDRETTGFGVAWLHTSGFNLAANWTEVKGISGSATDGRKGQTTWVKAGFKFGTHAIALDYGIYEDNGAAGDEGDSIGIGYVWNPVRWAELYASYHLFTLDRPSVVGGLEDINVYVIGTRVRF